MFRLFCLSIGYLLGCMQTAYIVAKIFYKIDIREHGSGNAGFTNALRILGTKVGILVFTLDFSKSIIAFIACSVIFGGAGTFTVGDSVLPGLYAGLGVVLGHNYPFYLKFKGGKGIASSLSIIFCLNAIVGGIIYAVGLVSISLTRYVSLASLIMLALFPIMMIVFGYGAEAVVIAFLFTILAYYKHIGNIQRLLSGTERKFSFNVKSRKSV